MQFSRDLVDLAVRSHCWENDFEAFVGYGCRLPSPAFGVSDDDADEIMEILVDLDWNEMLWEQGGYAIRYASDSESSSVGLFHANDLVGFYEGSCLWISPAHRGQGLSTPLILAAAAKRHGCAVPGGVEMHGYSPAGLEAHRKAWQRGVELALEAKQPVPKSVAGAVKTKTTMKMR